MEKKPSAEEHFYDIAYFNKWLKELDAEKKETVIYMLEEFAKYFRGEAVSDAVKFTEWISNNLFARRNYFWKSAQKRYFGVDYTTEELYELFKTKTNE